MKKASLIKNSLSAIIQVIVVGVTYLLLYWYLLRTIGIELLGVWSLVIASTSMALLANFGISTSTIKFVASYMARNDFGGLKKLLFTSLAFILCTYVFTGILLLFIGQWLLPYFIEDNYIGIALEILPYSILCLIINALNGVLNSTLDGIQKNYIKSYILSGSTIVLFCLSIVLTKPYGLKGLVFAQIVQAVLVIVLSCLAVNRHLKGVLTYRWNWSREVFREIMNYGLKMQSLSLMQMTYEPVTKALLSKFGGLAMVGYYEMASRLVLQLRSLIVNANQVVIPVVAEAKETNVGFIKELYLKTFSIILFLNIMLTSAIVIAAPVISHLWIGQFIPFFIFTVILNSVIVFVNISSNPAYFSFLGEGKLNWLIYSYLSVTIINVAAGYILGSMFGAYGVVIGWNLAFLAGSLVIIFSFHKTNSILWSTVINRHNFTLLLNAVALCFFAYNFLLNFINWSFETLYFAGFAISLILFVFLSLKNENFVFLMGEFKKLKLRKGDAK